MMRMKYLYYQRALQKLYQLFKEMELTIDRYDEYILNNHIQNIKSILWNVNDQPIIVNKKRRQPSSAKNK